MFPEEQPPTHQSGDITRKVSSTASTSPQPTTTHVDPSLDDDRADETVTLPRPEGQLATEISQFFNSTKYQIKHRLGQGGMGKVDFAHDTFLDRQVAIKRPLDPESVETSVRLVQEARTMGQLDHPNLPTIFSLEVDEQGSPLYAMRYEGDLSLSKLIDDLRRQTNGVDEFSGLAIKLDIFQGLLQALNYAHAKSTLHRDIKPANVMVGPCGEVKLIDWGIASRLSETSSVATESFSGTPRYSPPELVDPAIGPVDQRSDLYSAFVTLFELLTLESYICTDLSLDEIIQQVKAKQPPSVDDPCYVKKTTAALPKELRYFLARGLAPQPGDRFQCAQEALDELRSIRQGEIQSLCVITAIKKGLRWFERGLDRWPRTFAVSLILTAGTLGSLSLLGVAKLIGLNF